MSHAEEVMEQIKRGNHLEIKLQQVRKAAQKVEDAYWTWRHCYPEQEQETSRALEAAIEELNGQT